MSGVAQDRYSCNILKKGFYMNVRLIQLAIEHELKNLEPV